MIKKPTISVVIPAYNEEKVIQNTLRQVQSYVKNKFYDYEIIVVNDGSNDRTEEKLWKVENIHRLSFKENRGKGFAVRKGVLESQSNLILFMDADHSTNITELDKLMLKTKVCDIVLGSRAIAGAKISVGQNFLKIFLGRMGNLLIQRILHLSIKDTQCGFKLYKENIKPIFAKQKINSWGFDFEVLFLAKKAGLKICEVPVTWTNNFDSRVKASDYLKTLVNLLQIRVRYFLNKY